MTKKMEDIDVSELAPGGSNAPINHVTSLENWSGEPGAFQLRQEVAQNQLMESLIVNRDSETLVVSLHGATDRQKTILPRYEWLRSLLTYDTSCVFFSDTTLYRSTALQLAWYTGWEGFDLQRQIARQVAKLAELMSATRVLVMGASGGGFAALQVSALLEGSEAIAFNAQTDITKYRVNGESLGAQRTYLSKVWPELWGDRISEADLATGTWGMEVGDRVSAIKRYSKKTANTVHIVQNAEEFHYEEHFVPFVETARQAGNRINTHVNREGNMHNPPRMETWRSHMDSLLR